jgi:hypothetical protein
LAILKSPVVEETILSRDLVDLHPPSGERMTASAHQELATSGKIWPISVVIEYKGIETPPNAAGSLRDPRLHAT